jgi:sortase A
MASVLSWLLRDWMRLAVRPQAAAQFAAALFSRASAKIIGLAISSILSSVFTLYASWIPLKAGLAQILLQQSWAAQLEGQQQRPWPWADTHAIAELRVARLNVRQIVLAGSSGRNLAFGPALSESSLQMQDWIINGHRDTHFRFLQDLQLGDELLLETADGLQRYEINSLDVIDSRRFQLVLEPGVRRLSLVTCYPFDAVTAGGPLRYVVTALPVGEGGFKTGFRPPAASSG